MLQIEQINLLTIIYNVKKGEMCEVAENFLSKIKKRLNYLMGFCL